MCSRRATSPSVAACSTIAAERVSNVITRRLDGHEVLALGPDLLRLQHSAYAVEARLIGDTRIPPLHETEQELVSSGLYWIAAFEGTHLIGAVGYTIENKLVDLARLIVDPQHRRRGVGAGLVATVANLAPCAVVSTGRDNVPARTLYERQGFTHESDIEVVPGLWVSRYSRCQPN